MKKITSLLVLALLLVLSACGADESKEADDQNDQGTSETNQSSNNEDDNESEEDLDLDELDMDNLTEEDWENLHLSKKQFDQLLDYFTEPDGEDGEVVFNTVEMTNDKEIVMTVNNSDGESLENSITVLMGEIVRQFYNRSDYYKNEEPTIKIVDLSGFVISETDEPIDFDFEE
ncbi:hypothetical protein [Jeotgalibacillus marinus]|uniref:YusW-like protein n=1 Tax=Jeotgalibacillus marinus TaxID=86667 RepID=A0ABV3Q5W0_9BACL